MRGKGRKNVYIFSLGKKKTDPGLRIRIRVRLFSLDPDLYSDIFMCKGTRHIIVEIKFIIEYLENK